MDQYQQPTTVVPPSQFSIGGILSRTFSVLLMKPALFISMLAIAQIPIFIGLLLFPASVFGNATMQIISGILGLAVQGAIAYATFQLLQGNNVSFGDCINRGMARLVPLFLASLLIGLGVGVGMVLFLIPGIILMCFWAVAVPACVVEHLSATASLSRSTELTKGFRWQIFALALVVSLVTIAIVFGLIFAAEAMSGNAALGKAAATLINIIPAAFGAIMYAIIYSELRSIKEGITLTSLTKVFE